MRYDKASRSFAAGIVVGLLIGSTSAAVAALSHKAWERFGRQFQVGYVAGFLDMANLARNLSPGGDVDTWYPLWPKATLADWVGAVRHLYEEPDNQKYEMYAMMRLAGEELKKKYGPAPTALERLTPKLEQQLERAGQAEKRAAPKTASKPKTNATPSAKPARPEAASAATGAQAAAADRPPNYPWGHRRKRCACPDDGGTKKGQAATPQKGAEKAPAASGEAGGDKK